MPDINDFKKLLDAYKQSQGITTDDTAPEPDAQPLPPASQVLNPPPALPPASQVLNQADIAPPPAPAAQPAPVALPDLDKEEAPKAEADDKDEEDTEDKPKKKLDIKDALFQQIYKKLNEQDQNDAPSNLEALVKKYQSLQTPIPSPASINFHGDSIGSVENLQKAQDASRLNSLVAGLGQSSDLLSAGLNRTGGPSAAYHTFSEMAKTANQPVEELQQKIAMEKNDPKSSYSAGMRDFLTKTFNIPISETTSANDLEKIQPALAKLYEQKQNRDSKALDAAIAASTKQSTASGNQIDRLLNTAAILQKGEETNAARATQVEDKKQQKTASDQAHALKDVSDQVQRLQSRGASKIAAQNELFANNALSLVDQYPNLQDMPKAQVELFMQEVAKIAKGGVATSGELHGLLPNSLIGNLQAVAGKLLNEPTGAQAQNYVNEMIPYLKDLKANSQKYLGTQVNNILESNKSRLKPEDYQNLQSVHQPYLDAFKGAGDASKAAQAKQDPKIAEYAQAHQLSYQQAQKILKARGYGE